MEVGLGLLLAHYHIAQMVARVFESNEQLVQPCGLAMELERVVHFVVVVVGCHFVLFLVVQENHSALVVALVKVGNGEYINAACLQRKRVLYPLLVLPHNRGWKSLQERSTGGKRLDTDTL